MSYLTDLQGILLISIDRLPYSHYVPSW